MIHESIRRRIVETYNSGLSGTYASAAALFGVGEATVSRLLRRQRETGGVEPSRVGGNNPRKVDLEWLKTHAEESPDARLIDRIEAWSERSGCRVASSTMSNAMKAIGWTYKKRHLPRLSESAKM